MKLYKNLYMKYDQDYIDQMNFKKISKSLQLTNKFLD